MQTAMKPWATAGVALIGAGAIAVGPIAPAPPDLRAADVQLTGLFDVPAVVAGDLYAIGATTAVALLDQIPAVMVVDPAVVALRNLIMNLPLAFQSDDPLAALQSLGGLLANAVVGFGQAAVGDVTEFAAAVGSLIPQLITNIGIAFDTVDPADLPQVIGNAVLGTVLSLTGLAAPGPLSIVAAATLAGTNLIDNLPIILAASIDQVVSGNPQAAFETIAGPVAAAVLGVVGVAIPGLIPAAAAAVTLLPQLGPNLQIGLEQAFQRASAGDVAGALSALTSPVVSTIAGIAHAAWTQPSVSEVENFRMDVEGPAALDNRVEVPRLKSVADTRISSLGAIHTVKLPLVSDDVDSDQPANGQVEKLAEGAVVLETPALVPEPAKPRAAKGVLADLGLTNRVTDRAEVNGARANPGKQLRGAIRDTRAAIRGATKSFRTSLADAVRTPRDRSGPVAAVGSASAAPTRTDNGVTGAQ